MVVAGVTAAYSQTEKNLPAEIYVEGGRHHVQGIAFDKAAGMMYLSFTTSFVKTDFEGNVVGSINRIQGHLGAMTFNPADRKVYASLECKDDVIGKGLSSFAKGRSMFYIAIIDVDKVTEVGMDSEDNDAFRIVCVKDATRDYHMTGFADKEYEHFYGCSGIDGVTIAPKLGKKGGKNYLYVAYGIYGDLGRNDNNHQVLLRYDIRKLNEYAGKVKFGDFYGEGPDKPLDKYFATRTGVCRTWLTTRRRGRCSWLCTRGARAYSRIMTCSCLTWLKSLSRSRWPVSSTTGRSIR